MNRLAIVVTLGAGLCAACSAPASTPSPTESEYFALLTARAISAGAGEQQLEVLRIAADEGGVTYAQVDALMGDFFDCAQDAGLEPTRLADKPVAPGVRAPNYEVGFGPYGTEEGDALTQDCLTKTVDFAMEALHQQPSSMEAQVSDIMSRKDEIGDCTAAHGHPLAADATFDEVREAVVATLDELGIDCDPHSE